MAKKAFSDLSGRGFALIHNQEFLPVMSYVLSSDMWIIVVCSIWDCFEAELEATAGQITLVLVVIGISWCAYVTPNCERCIGYQ